MSFYNGCSMRHRSECSMHDHDQSLQDRYVHSLFSQAGFTLIECLIVLAILSMFLMLVLPLYTNTVTHHEHEQFFEQFEQDVLYAQQLAMTEQTTVQIHFYPDFNRYRVEYNQNNSIYSRNFPEGVTYRETGDLQRVFTSNGTLGGGPYARGKVMFEYGQKNETKVREFTFQTATGRISSRTLE